MAVLVKWLRDRRGSTTIQSLLFIAIFVVILYLSFEVWKVLQIKQSLVGATYQAAKYISLNGLYWGLSTGKWAEQVWPYVVAELQNSTYVPEDAIRPGPYGSNPAITMWLNPECNRETYCEKGQFWIQINLTYEVWIPPRFGEARGVRLPLTLSNRVRAELECRP
jgi:hypothetical protein